MQKSVWEKAAVRLDSFLWTAILVSRGINEAWFPWVVCLVIGFSSCQLRCELIWSSSYIYNVSFMLILWCIIKYEITLQPFTDFGHYRDASSYLLIFKKIREIECVWEFCFFVRFDWHWHWHWFLCWNIEEAVSFMCMHIEWLRTSCF